MHRRLLLGLVPVLLASTAALAAPLPAAAASGVTDTGTTTYVINTAKNEIDVTVVKTIKNTTPPKVVQVVCSWTGATCPETTDYYYDSAYVWVPTQAASIKATSNAGKVSSSTYKSDAYGRELKLGYAAVYYGSTRTVTVTYVLPAAPRSAGGFRALKAYAEMCGNGSGIDTGSLSIVIPDGYDVGFTDGTKLTLSSDAKGVQTYTSGTVAEPDGFWTCMEATSPNTLTSSSVTAGTQDFNLRAWPEDKTWAAAIAADIVVDVPALEDLTGMQMPGGTVEIDEAGDWQLGEYAGNYNSTTKTTNLIEGTDKATVAHELSHIWFNHEMLADTWMYEGLAGYSEKAAGAGNFAPCTDPGAYPGTDSATIKTWMYLDVNSTVTDQKVADWQYAASCYLVTQIADAVGPANFKVVLQAAAVDQIAYQGATKAEVWSDGSGVISAQTFLDLVDEFGMLPNGVTDLDQAQTLFAKYNVFDADLLAARSVARTNYHSLVEAAGTWKLPLAVRSPMASWSFSTAQTAMDTSNQILALRPQIEKNLPGFSADGTALQAAFESATKQSDLDAVLVLAQQEVDAAAKIQQAKQANTGSRNPLQMIGLLGTDLSGPITQANTAIKDAKPKEATAAAQKVIDSVNSGTVGGLLRLAVLIGLLLAVLLLVVLGRLLRRRRRSGLVPAPDGGLSGAAPLGFDAPPPTVEVAPTAAESAPFDPAGVAPAPTTSTEPVQPE